MAMLHMQRVFIYALKKDRKAILELLQRSGAVEISNTKLDDDVFHKTDVAQAKTSFERYIALAKEASEILNRYTPEKKSLLSGFNGRKVISIEDYDEFKEKHDQTVRSAEQIISSTKEIAENKAEILRLEAQAEILKPWTTLDVPLSFAGTKNAKCYIGTLPRERTLDELYEKLADYLPLDIEIISSSKLQTCIFVLCMKDKADAVYEVLRTMEFAHPSITTDKAPIDQLQYLDNQIMEAYHLIEKAEAKLVSMESVRDDLLFLQDYDRMRADKYDVIGRASSSKNVFILKGFIPEKDAKALEDTLHANFELAVEFREPSGRDDVPRLLKNNAFASPLEGVVASFSPPGEGEADPTFIMSLFYYVLFGLMLSDAGYGALMILVCGIGLLKFKQMEEGMKKTLRMYLICGISTVFWGIMFGSYFGDLIDITSAKFFGEKIAIAPLWFFPVNEPMRMLTFSMAFGLLHLFAGLGMKLYQLYKQKDYKAVIYDVVLWYVLLTSLVIIVLSMKMITDILGVSIALPTVVIKGAQIAALLAAAGIILTNGRESKSPFKRFLKGLYALYGVSGYLGDVLSYSRLLALGLATGVICSVINQMASMVPGGVIGGILFTFFVIVGHLLNFAINALGAYVHTCRLQYVEFFGKFYGGGGRLFTPYGVNTKYFKFKEKMKNG